MTLLKPPSIDSKYDNQSRLYSTLGSRRKNNRRKLGLSREKEDTEYTNSSTLAVNEDEQTTGTVKRVLPSRWVPKSSRPDKSFEAEFEEKKDNQISKKLKSTKKTAFGPRKKMTKKKKAAIVCLTASLVALLTALIPISVSGYNLYSKIHSTALDGANHLQNALNLVGNGNSQSLDANTLAQVDSNLLIAKNDFIQVNTILQENSGEVNAAKMVPGVGQQISSIQHVVNMAIDLTTAGDELAKAFSPVIDRLHQPLSDNQTPITSTQISAIQSAVVDTNNLLNAAVKERSAFTINDLPNVGGLRSQIQKLDGKLPELQKSLNVLTPFMPVAPELLGIDKPANYLFLMQDSTELRATGGFIGNYAVIPVSGGSFNGHVNMQDVYLLDIPYGLKTRQLAPKEFSWLDPLYTSSGGTRYWGIRDANQSPDFPTAAQTVAQLYVQEDRSVGSLTGVVAITPAFIQNIITQVTGPIQVPEYRETVTADNLEVKIHQYQTDPTLIAKGRRLGSSDRKAFTAYLGQHLMEKLHGLSKDQMSKLFSVLTTSLQQKDLQIYFTDQNAESIINSDGYSNSVINNPGDGLMVVDTNIGGNKANMYVDESLNDQVAVQSNGDAVHNLTITYNWNRSGPLYGELGDYATRLRVLVPQGSQYVSSSGLANLYPSSTDANREEFSARILVVPHSIHTVHMSWRVPKAAINTNGKNTYNYYVQKQAGTSETLAVTVTLPDGSNSIQTNKLEGPWNQSNNKVSYSSPLNIDQPLQITYQ